MPLFFKARSVPLVVGFTVLCVLPLLLLRGGFRTFGNNVVGLLKFWKSSAGVKDKLNMTAIDLEDVTARLAQTTVDDEKVVSFAGKGLKLDNETDAEVVVKALLECQDMTTLCLEGNTLGVEAAKAIAKVLENQKCFKRALWKDMFTGRLKTEIPDALNYLSAGIMLADAQLIELDLSDNAFGPVGIKGIVELLKSKSCKSLQILRLNNNGLGITGGKHLAKALQSNIDSNSTGSGKFALKTFICGRNRLENDGAIAIADVLKQLGSLEEVAMPQNGIYHEGISAIADALSHNLHIKVINMNDNTLTEVGAKAFAKNIGSLSELEVINFGDCLIKTEGAIALAESLRDGHTNLKELHLGFNEITQPGGVAIAEAMENKSKLQKLELNGNAFGSEGCEMIEGTMEAIGLNSQLGTFSDDDGNGEDDDDDNEEDDEGSEDDDDDVDKYVGEDEEDSIRVVSDLDSSGEQDKENRNDNSPRIATVQEFLERPNSINLLYLGDNRVDLFMDELGEDPSIDSLLKYFIQVSCTLSETSEEAPKQAACECCDRFLSCVFNHADSNPSVTLLTNSFLVHLGLIKSEDKDFKSPSDLRGPLIVLEHCVKQPYFPKSTKHTLQFFLSQPNKKLDNTGKTKHKLMQTLFTM